MDAIETQAEGGVDLPSAPPDTAVSTAAAEFDIGAVIKRLLDKRLFTGFFLARVSRIVVNAPGMTCGVRYKDYQFSMLYNPEFLSKLSLAEQDTVIEHEALHIILKHVIFGPRYLKKGLVGIPHGENIPASSHMNHTVLNVAFDFAVNSFLHEAPKEFKKQAMFPEYYGLPEGKSHLYYLGKLLKEMNEVEAEGEAAEAPGSGKGNSCVGGKQPKPGGKGKQEEKGEKEDQEEQDPEKEKERFDKLAPSQRFNELAKSLLQQSEFQKMLGDLLDKLNHSWQTGEDGELSEEESQLLDEMLGAAVRDASESCRKNRGTVPGNLQSELTRLYTKRLPWNVLLRRFVTSAVHTSFRPAYNRKDRRFDIFPGHRRELKANVVIGTDTSGSVSDQLLSAFYNEVDAIYENQEIDLDIIECDADVRATYKYRRGTRPKCKGRGGTDFRPVFEHVKKHSMRPDVLIFFTDGYGPAPAKPPQGYLTIWVYPNKNHQKLPWGVHLEMSPDTAQF